VPLCYLLCAWFYLPGADPAALPAYLLTGHNAATALLGSCRAVLLMPASWFITAFLPLFRLRLGFAFTRPLSFAVLPHRRHACLMPMPAPLACCAALHRINARSSFYSGWNMPLHSTLLPRHRHCSTAPFIMHSPLLFSPYRAVNIARYACHDTLTFMTAMFLPLFAHLRGLFTSAQHRYCPPFCLCLLPVLLLFLSTPPPAVDSHRALRTSSFLRSCAVATTLSRIWIRAFHTCWNFCFHGTPHRCRRTYCGARCTTISLPRYTSAPVAFCAANLRCVRFSASRQPCQHHTLTCQHRTPPFYTLFVYVCLLTIARATLYNAHTDSYAIRAARLCTSVAGAGCHTLFPAAAHHTMLPASAGMSACRILPPLPLPVMIAAPAAALAPACL